MPEAVRNMTSQDLAKKCGLTREEYFEIQKKHGKEENFVKVWISIYKKAKELAAMYLAEWQNKPLADKLEKLLKEQLEPEKVYAKFGEITEEKITSFIPF
jgi:hypothetical protein